MKKILGLKEKIFQKIWMPNYSNSMTFLHYAIFAKSQTKNGYGKTSLYLLDSNYYLYISLYSGNSILEFADVTQNQDKTLAKISEYGKTIYKENAIKMMQKYLEV